MTPWKILALAVLAPSIAPTSGLDKGKVEDPRIGFSVRHPKGWTPLPLPVDERWIVARVVEDLEWSSAEMRVAAFVDGSTPYASYEDYLDEIFTGSQLVVRSEEQEEVDDVSVRALGLVSGTRRALAWVFALDGVQVVVHIEADEEPFEKLEREALRCLRSFRVTEREGALDDGTGFRLADLEALDPGERGARRKEWEEWLHGRGVACLPDGWSAKPIEPFLVLHHVDDSTVKKLTEHAGAVYAWLEETFPFVGPDEYVRSPILRICESYDELYAYQRALSAEASWEGADIEVVTCKQAYGKMSIQHDRISEQVLWIWLRERDRVLSRSLPRWLEKGLLDVLSDGRAKRGKLQFEDDDHDRDRIREALRGDGLTPLRALLPMGDGDFDDYDEGRHHYAQSGLVLQFLTSKAAARHDVSKDLLRDYVRNLTEVVHDLEAELHAAEEAAGDGEEREPDVETLDPDALEELEKKEREAEQARRDRIVREAFERTFAGWTERDWRVLENAFEETIR